MNLGKLVELLEAAIQTEDIARDQRKAAETALLDALEESGSPLENNKSIMVGDVQVSRNTWGSLQLFKITLLDPATETAVTTAEPSNIAPVTREISKNELETHIAN